MSKTVFPHPLDHLPRPGNREIRLSPIPDLPRIRNQKENEHAAP